MSHSAAEAEEMARLADLIEKGLRESLYKVVGVKAGPNGERQITLAPKPKKDDDGA